MQFRTLLLGLAASALPVGAQPLPFTSPLAETGQDKWITVPVEATVTMSPPRITLRVHKTERAYAVFRKGPHDLSWSTQIGTIPAGFGTWTDSDVSVGQEYEYRLHGGTVTGDSSSSTQLYGYLRAGVALDMTGWRGRVAVVVADDVPTNLPAEFNRYLADLVGDGWTPHVITAPKANGYAGTGKSHIPLREQIIALSSQYPGELKHVALLGNVPQPRSGLVYSGPDGHGNKAAFGVDAYYAELDGTWTDTGTNTSTVTGVNDAKRNVADDGKFDETRTPTNDWEHVELGFGRMDMQLLDEGPTEALRNYLEKLHRYKHAAVDFQPGRRAMIREGFDNVTETAWNSLPALVGLQNIEYNASTGALNFSSYDLDQRASESFGPYLFYFKGDGPPVRGVGGRAVFWTGLQSNWGYWYEHDAMPKALAEDSLTLSYTWSVWGTRYFYHRMGLGDVVGDMMKTSINNRGWNSVDGLHRIDSNYWPNGNYTGSLFMNHLGDPLLRLFMFPPAADLAAIPEAEGVSLSWIPSEDPAVVGYHVYRSPSMEQPFVRLTTSPVAGTTFTDASVSTGVHLFMVRAVKLETTGSGMFWNGSQGIFATANFSGGTPLTISTTTLPPGYPQFSYETPIVATGGIPPLAWSLVSGQFPEGLSLSESGLLQGTPKTSGTSNFEVRVTDATGAAATRQLSLTVANDTRREFLIDADAGTNSNSSVQGNNYGASRALILATGTPLGAWCDTVFLRFRLTPPSGGSVSKAVLRLRPNEFSTSSASNTLSFRLVDNDAWVEGDHEGAAANNQPSGELVFANRPVPNGSIPAVTVPASFNPTSAWEIDVTSLVNADFATDSSGLVTLQMTLSGNRLSFATKETLVSRLAPRLVVDYPDAGPEVAVLSPLGQRALLAPGHALQLSASVSHPTLAQQQLIAAWSVLKAPDGAATTFSSSSELNTSFEADKEGSYTLRLTVSDGVRSAQREVQLEITGSHASAVLPPEIVHYPLDETSGTTAKNLASGPDGQLVNFAPSGGWVTGGRHGGALDFTADSGSLRAHIRALTHADYDFSFQRPWTVSLWLRTTQTTNQDLAGKALASQTQKQLRLRHESGNSRSAVVLGGTHTTNIPYDRFRLNDGTWRLVTLVHNPATPSSLLFLDGGLTQYAVLGLGAETTLEDFLIGAVRNASSTDTAGDFDGQIDDVRVYDRALSWGEVRDLALGTPFNRAPVLTLHGPSTTIEAGVLANFSATLWEDALPGGSSVSLLWEKVSGPGAVTFSAPGAAATGATFSAPGNYLLRLVAGDGQAAASVSIPVVVVVPGGSAGNTAPQVQAGQDQNSTTPGVFQLTGSATDDGVPGPLLTRWRQLAGSGVVTFSNPENPVTSVAVRGEGEYVLELTANDGALSASSIVRLVISQPPNTAPVVSTAPNLTQIVNLPATLQASASDDGLPNPPAALTYSWSRMSGPGTVTFSNTAALNPQVTFTAIGSHTLRLEVSDGQLSSVAFVAVTVELDAAGNQSPVADIHESEVVGQFPDTAFLSATISDDGLPNPPGQLTVQWTLDSGPGEVVVQPASEAGRFAINATEPGAYTLRLSLSDGAATATDTVNVVFQETARHRLIWAWGRSSNGEAGPFGITNSSLPRPVVVGRGWTKPLPGESNGLALVAKSGNVLATGRTTNSVLGDPLAPARAYFAPVPGLTDILDVAFATETGAALHPDGTVSTWGKSSNGALGNGLQSSTVVSPTQLVGFSGVQKLFGYYRTFYALKQDGSLWAWGYNSNGKIGNGSTTNVLAPTAINGLSGIAAVAPGAVHSVFLKMDGTVLASGFNYYGSVGDGSYGFGTDRATPVQVLTSTNPATPLSGIRKIVAGFYYTLALDDSGRVWAWGYNGTGMLGQQDTAHRPLATLVKNAAGTSPLEGVVDIAAGAYTAFALLADGSVLGWGSGQNNLFGENQSTDNRTLPGPVGGLPTNISAIWANTYTAYASTPWATYEGFVAEHFSPAEIDGGEAEPNYDFERDGTNTLLEYATGGDPRTADSTERGSLRMEGGQLVFEIEILTAAEDLEFSFETSTNLSNWQTATPLASSAEDLGDFDRIQLRFDLPGDGSKLFLRTKANLILPEQ